MTKHAIVILQKTVHIQAGIIKSLQREARVLRGQLKLAWHHADRLFAQAGRRTQ